MPTFLDSLLEVLAIAIPTGVAVELSIAFVEFIKGIR